ncbi:YCF48-related protein [Hymenobacter sediminis]|uniref:YCF48-related protein n=1 Tax=Hymenobacter sediminis TaxID=2218621 RepID=UPI00138FD36E|nr:YCF48-related protein [Hymenobacter sediminis]
MLQELGLVLRTEDAGATWQEGRRFTDASTLDCSPQGVGYLLTRPGVLWRTSDAGRSWQRQSGAPHPPPYSGSYGPPPLAHVYTRLHAVSTDTVVEIAWDGLVRRSTDAGRHWQAFKSPVTDVLSSSFPSGRVGYLGTWGGRVYKTTDGGATWTKLSEQTYFPSEITMLHFVTPQLGFAHREHSDLLRTTDGGLTWTLLSTRLQDVIDMQFVSPTTGYAVGDYGTIYQTTDAGLSWSSQATGLGGLVGGNRWSSVWFTSPMIGYVVGQSSQGPLLRTEDGGKTWRPLSGRRGTVFTLQFPGHGLTGYALTSDGVLKTIDGGDTWVVLPGVGGTLLSCPDVNTVVVAGHGGTVSRSGDGGVTWKTSVIPARYSFGNNLVALHMATSQIGYVAGEDTYSSYAGQVLARTQDGGQSWVVLTGPQVHGLRNFTFSTPTTGYATGSQGLYKTSDSGQNWHLLPVPIYGGPSDVEFVDEQVGFAIDEYGTFYKTEDGARTWQQSQLNHTIYAPGHPKYVHFMDRMTGCIQTDNSDVFRTTDGGRTWIWEFNMGSQAMAYTHQGKALLLGGPQGMLVRRSLESQPLPFQAQMAPPQQLTDSSVVLTGKLTWLNCIVNADRFEYAPVNAPADSAVAPAFPILWYGGDSVQTNVLMGLQPETTYRVRLRVQHNGAYYYSKDTLFTTLPRPVLPLPELTAFPNPTTGYVRVVEPGRREVAQIRVYTLRGTLVRETTARGVDLGDLQAGMYLLRVRISEQERHYRVIKQ